MRNSSATRVRNHPSVVDSNSVAGVSTMRLVKVQGFTLIELMIVVVIIGILAAIAYPSYINFVKRSARSEAKGALMEDAQFLERTYTLSNKYNLDSAGNTVNTATLPTQATPRNGTAKYNITVTTGASTYTLTAAPTGAMTGDPCGSLT